MTEPVPRGEATERAPVREEALVFACQGDQLPGVLHRPARPCGRGVLVVVGGPQTRVGSHRQFVLLARGLAAAGFPVLRFDYRGMGDAGGDYLGFEAVGEDIRAAVDAFQDQCPEVTEVALWGLCDAATAAAFYAHSDPRVTGLVLLNPWVRTEQGEAEAYLKHYYVRRLLQMDFWRGLIKGRFNPARSLASLAGNMGRARAGASGSPGADLPQRMAAGLSAFSGRILLVLSGNDLTAQEFRQATQRGAGWRAILERPLVRTVEVAAANHTFSRAEWRREVERVTASWLADD